MNDIHQQIFKLYLMQLDGSPLTASQLALLQTHLAGCPACRADRRIYQGLRAQAGQRWAAQSMEAPIALERVLPGPRRERHPQRATLPLGALVWTGFVMLVLALILFIFSTTRPLPALQPAASPTPRVFDAPHSEVSAHTLIFHEGCHFGGAVAMDENLIVVGAPCWGRPPGEGAGSVTILRRSPDGKLNVETTLTAGDRDDGFQRDQNFGMSVAIMNETMLAIGAPGYDDPQAGDDTGAVYLFEYNGSDWVETGKLLAGSPQPGARLGSTLAFDGDFLAVSGSPQAGGVLVFQRSGQGDWRQQAEVPVPPAADGKLYDVLMDLYGDTLAISTVIQSPLPDSSDQEALLRSLKTSGTVTLYERVGDAWQKAYQTPPQEAALYEMVENVSGIPVALGGEGGRATWLAVGKPGFAGSGRETGSVAIFARGAQGWEAQTELALAPGEPVPGALPFFGHDPGPVFFGANVEIEGNRLAVISTFANTAYVFERRGQNWEYLYRITPARENSSDDFQRRITAMDGNFLLMGSPGELAGGEIYLFNLQP